jgi:hypothetical protein
MTTTVPTSLPTNAPTQPINTPKTTTIPTSLPTNAPTIPTFLPTNAVTIPPFIPTIQPFIPTSLPTNAPTIPPFIPTIPPFIPTNAPTSIPTRKPPPTFSPIPTISPSRLTTDISNTMPQSVSDFNSIIQTNPTQSDPTKSDSTKSDSTKSDSTKSDSTKSDSTKSDSTKSNPTQSNPNPTLSTVQYVSATNGPTYVMVTSTSYDTTTIVIISSIILLLLVVIYILYKLIYRKQKTTSLPDDIKKYKEKHKGEILIRLDNIKKEGEKEGDENENDNENEIKIDIARLDFKKQISMKKSIKDDELSYHTAISYSSFYHVYEAVKKNWNVSFTTSGLKKYTPISSKSLSIFAIYQNIEQLCNPLKSYTVKKVIQSNDNQNIIVVSIEERTTNFFKEKYLLVMDVSTLYCITAKTNIPEYNVFYNYSYRTYEDFSRHFLHEKVKEAKDHISEYDKLSIKDIEGGNVSLSKISIIQNKYKDASAFLKELENLQSNMKNVIYKLRHFE